jgi:hypothetical protein
MWHGKNMRSLFHEVIDPAIIINLPVTTVDFSTLRAGRDQGVLCDNGWMGVGSNVDLTGEMDSIAPVGSVITIAASTSTP